MKQMLVKTSYFFDQRVQICKYVQMCVLIINLKQLFSDSRIRRAENVLKMYKIQNMLCVMYEISIKCALIMQKKKMQNTKNKTSYTESLKQMLV